MPLLKNMTKSNAADDCKLKKTVAEIMFWSDSTHLANFGTAKL